MTTRKGKSCKPETEFPTSILEEPNDEKENHTLVIATVVPVAFIAIATAAAIVYIMKRKVNSNNDPKPPKKQKKKSNKGTFEFPPTESK